MITIQNLSFSYDGGPEVLKGLNFSIDPGEIFGIIGPNGSGKSTLIKLITGTLPIIRGDVLVSEKSVRKMKRKALAQTFAVVPQAFETTFPFTVTEMVLMGRLAHREGTFFESRADIEIANQAMMLTDTVDFRERYIQELSAGERQRVIIARAIAQKPQVLCLDEPTSSLDIKYQTGTYDLVKRLRREQGMTVVTVLHDLNLASMYCDKLLLLKKGEAFAIGSPKDVITVENISRVYETEVRVFPSQASGAPFLVPVSKVDA